MRAKVIADSLNVRIQPNAQGSVVGLLTMNQEVEVLSVADGWAALKLNAGGVDLAFGGQPAVVYTFAEFLNLGSGGGNTDNTEAQHFRLGLHTMSNTHLAKQEAERGCQFFLVMNDFGGAANLKALPSQRSRHGAAIHRTSRVNFG